MIKTGSALWRSHPHVANDLTFGERAADGLKHWFGTWTALFCIFAFICTWIAVQGTGAAWDLYPFILLNLLLSCVAAVQGIILQISANRGDRLNAEVALHTQKNTDEILSINHVQLGILNELRRLNDALGNPPSAIPADVEPPVPM